MWDEEHNHHLFTSGGLREAEVMISLAAEHDMAMLAPEGHSYFGSNGKLRIGLTLIMSLAAACWRIKWCAVTPTPGSGARH